jgi:N-acyl-D-amino-acid deacylase
MAGLTFRGATVVDGTGAPAYRGDVSVHNGRISTTAQGRVIDADGLVLAPGFIDMHAHSDLQILANPDHMAKVSQGVTLEVLGQDGLSYAPVDDETLAGLRTQLAGWNDDPAGFDWNWRGVGEYLDRLDTGIAVNAAYLVPQGTVRMLAVGWESRPATPSELDTMRSLVATGLAEGAMGMSSGLTYTPGMYATTDELVALCEVVAAHGGIYATHARANAGAGEFAAVEEAIEIGRRSGVRVEFSHLAINDPRNWGRGHELLALFDAAVAEGVDIGFDVYPYDASSSALTQYLPAWVQAGGHAAMAERLRDAQVRRRALADLAAGWAGGIPWHWDRVTVCQAPPESQDRVGRTLAEIAQDDGADPAAVMLDLCERHFNAVKVVLHYRTEADMLAFLRHPLALVGSDGNAIGADQHGDRPHPRHFGCFPRVLGRYVRDQRALGLAEAVHKMTGKTAAWLGLSDRGRLAEGLVADLVAFDPERVADTATFLDPCRLAAGVTHVVVAGELVLDGGVQTAARPGRVLRRPTDDGG